MAEEFRYIVRVAGKDLNGSLAIWRSMLSIKGVNHRMAKVIAKAFEKETGISSETPVGTIPEDMDKKLEHVLLNPTQYQIPAWMFNRRNDFETGENIHHIMADLDFDKRKDLERVKIIRSYKGIRHSLGLPVRGQRTRSSFRQRGKTVGVMKKDAVKSAAPATAATAPKKEEKKK